MSNGEIVEVVASELAEGTFEETEAQIAEAMVSGREAIKRLGFLLAKIKVHPDWIPEEYETFEQYVEHRWDIRRSRVYQLIDFAQVSTIVENAGLPAPANEGQVRPLAGLLHKHGADHMAATWDDVAKAYDGSPTAKQVSEFLDGSPAGAKNKPGWSELLGGVGDTLDRAEKQLRRLMDGVSRKPGQKFAARAEALAVQAEVLALNLRGMPGDWTDPNALEEPDEEADD